MGVELIMLITVLIFILLKTNFLSALLIYAGYQLTFIFGGYLVRAETLVAEDKKLLKHIDISKQLGYLLGLGVSFLFYKTLEYGFNISEAEVQIRILHYFLVFLQSAIILFLVNSFSWK